ncbi:MAG: hypothetical protein AB1486_31210 [Planctomycetota bacterium]
MTPSPAVIVIAKACPNRAAAIERLVQGQLGAPDREALEHHLHTCARCQGYREWLRVESMTARDLAAQRATQVALDHVRRDLEQRIAHMRASEAAVALTELARWHLVRRAAADPTLYASHTPSSASQTRRRVERAVEQLRSTPWKVGGTNQIEETGLSVVLDPDRDLDHRTLSRAALDLALQIDSYCFPAITARSTLIHEDGYRELRTLELDWERLLRRGDSRMQAEAHAQRACWLSKVQGALDDSTGDFLKAHQLNPARADYAYNAWLLAEIQGRRGVSASAWSGLRAASRRYTGARRRRALQAFACALDYALSECHLSRSAYSRCSKALRGILTES